MLCKFAYSAYEQYHTFRLQDIFPKYQLKHSRYSTLQYTYLPIHKFRKVGDIRGMLVNYEDLPGILFSLLYQIWGVNQISPTHSLLSLSFLNNKVVDNKVVDHKSIPVITFQFNSLLLALEDEINKKIQGISTISNSLSPLLLENFQKESQEYSKTGSTWKIFGDKFSGDSKKKDNWANHEIQDISSEILGDLYNRMKNTTDNDLERVFQIHFNNNNKDIKDITDIKNIRDIPKSIVKIETNKQISNEKNNQQEMKWYLPSMLTGYHKSQSKEVNVKFCFSI